MKRFMKLIPLVLVFPLTSCALFDKIAGFFGGGAKEEGDTTVYGTGAESETLRVGPQFPEGEYVVFSRLDNAEAGTSEAVVYKNASHQMTNVYFATSFKTSSIVKVSSGQDLVLKYAVAININSSPEVKTFKNGMFKVGTHIAAGDIKVKGLSSTAGTTGMFEIYKNLEALYGLATDLSEYSNVVAGDAEYTIKNVPSGYYLSLTNLEIVK